MPCTPEEIKQLAKLLSESSDDMARITAILKDPPSAAGAAEAETRSKMGIFSNIRTQRGAFGDVFSASVLNRLQRGTIEYHNLLSGAARDAKEAYTPFELSTTNKLLDIGPGQQNRDNVGKILDSFLDSSGKYTGPVNAFTEQEIDSARILRKAYNKHGKIFNIDPDTWLNYYLPHIKARKRTLFTDAPETPMDEVVRSRMGQDELMFYHERERTGNMVNYEMDAFEAFNEYVRAGYRNKFLRPLLDDLDSNFVDGYFNRRIIRSGNDTFNLVNDKVAYKHWIDLKSHVLGAPTDSDVALLNSFNNLAGMFGKQIDQRDVYKFSQMTSTLWYAGVLGGPIGTRPASLFRHATRLIPSLAEMGPKYFMQGIKDALSEGSIKKLEERNMLSSAFENIEREVTNARVAGRAISRTAESSLKLFSASDKLWRAITAYGSEAKINDYIARNAIEKMPASKAIKEQVVKLVKEGKPDEARDLYMFDNLAKLEYVYGPANRPAVFRSALGNLAGTLLSYPLNTAELIKTFSTDFAESARTGFKEGNPAPLIRYVAITGGLVMAGAQFAGVDLTNLFWHGAMPTTVPMLEIGKNVYLSGEYSLKWVLGNVFQTGETDFHAHEREKYSKEALKGLANFIPGSVFAQDAYRVIEEQDLTSALRGLGFPPTADIINQQQKERASLRRREQRGESQRTGGLSPL